MSFRLFVDVSSTHISGHKTGIQRVIRSLSKEFSKFATDHRVEVFLVTCDPNNRGRYNLLSEFEFTADGSQKRNAFSSDQFFSSKYFLLIKKLSRLLRRFDFLRVLDSSLGKVLASKVVNVLFSLYIYRLSRINLMPVKFKQGDVLLLADAFWSTPNFLPATRRAKRRGARIAVLIHDIIPLTHPEFCDLRFVNQFSKTLPDLLALADVLFYPSFYTRDQLVSRFFPDGISIPHKRILWGVSKDQTRYMYGDIPRHRNSIIMVGTVEPRKNHLLVIDWYRSMATAQTKLTVIGKSGWMNENVTDSLRKEAKHNINFRWLEDTSDKNLAYEMARHEIGIMASHVEGLGLPVLEYSSAGLKLVLSNIPVFREIASGSAYFFDNTSIESLDKVIRSAMAYKTVSSLREVFWEDTASDILVFLENHLAH